MDFMHSKRVTAGFGAVQEQQNFFANQKLLNESQAYEESSDIDVASISSDANFIPVDFQISFVKS